MALKVSSGYNVRDFFPIEIEHYCSVQYCTVDYLVSIQKVQ